jgi:hypothetical protein
VRPPGGLHAYFAGTSRHNGRMPSYHLDFRSAGGYILAPPSHVGQPCQLIRRLDGRGGLDWAAVIRLLEPQRYQQRLASGPARDRALSQLVRRLGALNFSDAIVLFGASLLVSIRSSSC